MPRANGPVTEPPQNRNGTTPKKPIRVLEGFEFPRRSAAEVSNLPVPTPVPKEEVAIEIAREDLLWLAGYLEGEGSFLVRVRRKTTGWSEPPKITVEAVDEDVIRRAASLMGGTMVFNQLSLKNPKWQDTHRTFVSNKRAAFIMQLLLPLMGKRRAAKIAEILQVEKEYALVNPKERTACKNCGTPYDQYVRNGDEQRTCRNCRNRVGREAYHRRKARATS